MASDVNELKEALEAAASEEEVAEESSTEANAEAATEEDADKSKPKSGKNANSRIQELVAARKKIEAERDAYQADLKKKDSELGDMLKMLQQKESDSRTIQAIKDLHARDDKWRTTIEKLDKVLKGETVEPDETVDAKPKDGSKEDNAELAKVRDLLSKSQAELEEKVAEQRANLILDKVDRIVDRYMENLPDGYGKEDRRILQETLSDHIDWTAINTNPDDVQKQVVAGLQKCITWYGRPKGEAPAAPSKDAQNGASVVSQPTDPKVELDGLLKRTDYGKAKIVETKEGGKRFEAAVSDDQFVADLAKALRAARAANLGKG